LTKGFQEAPLRKALEFTYRKMGEDALRGAVFELRRCPNCELIFQRQVYDENDTRRYYDDAIPLECTEQSNFNFQAVAYASNNFSSLCCVLRYIKKDPLRLRAYEYGMGMGRWCMLARALGCGVSCWDIAPSRNQAMRERGFEILPPEDLPAEGFDIINCEQVLEHAAQPRRIVNTLAKALKPGGLLIVDTPNCRKLLRRLQRKDPDRIFEEDRFRGLFHPLEHINCFTQKPLLRMASDAGLKRIKPPLWPRYACQTYWFGAGRIARNLLCPLRDWIFDHSVMLWLTKG
jgi:SAM-dependent methyltransferase